MTESKKNYKQLLYIPTTLADKLKELARQVRKTTGDDMSWQDLARRYIERQIEKEKEN